ncbi:MAG: NAD-dependent deacylase [Hyphomicrobiaceae bacterium]
MSGAERIVILTGAGISAESGVSTFRDKDGIWAKYDYRDVATPDGFRRNPELVLDFYNQRRRLHAGIEPNAAHLALARLEREHGSDVLVVTQNVDRLHEAAGTTRLIHMHGEVMKAWCLACDTRHPWTEDILHASACPGCGKTRRLRPDVVWFGEMPYRLDEIAEAVTAADLFISIGTSGTVYPAAGLVRLAKANGARTVELNLEPSEGASQFDEAIHGPATVVVPQFVERLLRGETTRTIAR